MAANSTRRVRKQVKQKLDKAGEPWIDRIPATLGDASGNVAVPGTTNMVYARLPDGQVKEVFNASAPAIANWKVFVGRDKSQPSLFKVTEVRWVYNLAQTVAYVLFHHGQHEYPALDTVWVRRDQFMPLLVLPNSGFHVSLYGDVIYTSSMSNPIRVADQLDIDLNSYVPGAGAVYVLMEIKSDGTLNYSVSSVYTSIDVLRVSAPFPAPTPGNFPVCVIELYEGQTEIRRDSEVRNIIDLRMFTSDTTVSMGGQIHSAIAGTPGASDEWGFWDATNNVLKKITSTNFKLWLAAYFGALYSAIGHTHDASTITYSPATVTDWNSGADPGNTDAGLDQLASRVTTIETTPPPIIGRYRQFVYEVGGGNITFLTDVDGYPLFNLEDLE